MFRGRSSSLTAAVVAVLVAATLTPVAQSAGAATLTATFAVQPSVNQVAVTGASPGASAVLRTVAGTTVATRKVDRAGSALFRRVDAGPGYRVAVGKVRSPEVTVAAPDDTPPSTLYTSQVLDLGYGYLKTRDGTSLSVNVKLPGPADEGPYPTVVEYSGYDPSNPVAQQPASRIALMLGFATVGVNLRGTGCSGGAFDYFETLQSLDGYDVIETVAAQPWVANGKVGMVGISYPGITQLFVAGTRPPHLAAITPLSVLDDTYDTLYPGGIFNNGFALGWAEERKDDARPAKVDGGGQQWAARRIAKGDTICGKNQELRLQAADIDAEIRANRFRRGAATEALAPASSLSQIDVPVFLAGTWQDQETGSHVANVLGELSADIPVKITLMNGLHQDTIGPAVFAQWVEFLDFYVAGRIPELSPVLRILATTAFHRLFGGDVSFPPDRFTDQPDFASALRAYEAEPRVRLLFEAGGGGSPVPAFGTTAPAWPLPATTPTTWYFGPDGALGDAPPTSTSGGADRFDYDPSAFPRTSATRNDETRASDAAADVGGGELTPQYRWEPVPGGKALAYVSTPLGADTVLAGTGSVDLWLRATEPDVDVEVTISEVRPDGKETYVQSGWLRASQRALDAEASTDLLPVQTHTRADAAPLPTGDRAKASLLRVPLYPFAHAFRAGSRIRIVVQPPGGNRPAWAFDAQPDSATVTLSRSAAHPSQVVLPVVSGIDVTTALPGCGTLRGQPCRTYRPLANREASS